MKKLRLKEFLEISQSQTGQKRSWSQASGGSCAGAAVTRRSAVPEGALLCSPQTREPPPARSNTARPPRAPPAAGPQRSLAVSVRGLRVSEHVSPALRAPAGCSNVMVVSLRLGHSGDIY